MEDVLKNIHIDDLPYLERDLHIAQKVSLAFLLFGDSHGHATYILQKLLALMRSPQSEQMHSDLLHQYALNANPTHWRGHLIEALCIIDARQALRKLGLNWPELRLHYLPHVRELALHIHPLLKAMYHICEQLTITQSGRLILDLNEKLTRHKQNNEPLHFYDADYLEIFLLDWLTHRHLRLGDINAVGSDVQLLIEYFKFNDLKSLATLLIETVNSGAATQAADNTLPVEAVAKEEKDAVAVESDAAANAPTAALDRCPNALQVRRKNAGIMLIINQQRFHRDVGEDVRHLLPTVKLSDRNGTDKDKERLTDVFSGLGYQVEAHDNVDHWELLDHIRSACSRSQLRDSVIVCILSHGFEGAVYGANSIALSIVDIQNVLCGNRDLHDKPKLLIIQACQQKEDLNQTCIVNARTESPIQQANMVLAMSTVARFVALRHSVKGSWFIQTLCDTVERKAATEHLLDILTYVIGKVSTQRGDNKQMMVPIVANTLKQKVYFSDN
ncbi:caspase-8 [Drosophila grimshawi]|uniref:GH24782 n=1 Tax=Drosophila grimshawi TaxID=7222 RepID=B4JNA9_DROGR|nr:caspase-8 [Drosophila grimshawi]EDV92202.1 GH24782 [Drosophila grimshawi]